MHTMQISDSHRPPPYVQLKAEVGSIARFTQPHIKSHCVLLPVQGEPDTGLPLYQQGPVARS